MPTETGARREHTAIDGSAFASSNTIMASRLGPARQRLEIESQRPTGHAQVRQYLAAPTPASEVTHTSKATEKIIREVAGVQSAQCSPEFSAPRRVMFACRSVTSCRMSGAGGGEKRQ
jgi:hypothetical protein